MFLLCELFTLIKICLAFVVVAAKKCWPCHSVCTKLSANSVDYRYRHCLVVSWTLDSVKDWGKKNWKFMFRWTVLN